MVVVVAFVVSAGASAGWLQLNAIAPSADSRSVFFMLFKVNKYVILFNSITHRNVHGFYCSVLFGLETSLICWNSFRKSDKQWRVNDSNSLRSIGVC